jgi:hypothetical protein
VQNTYHPPVKRYTQPNAVCLAWFLPRNCRLSGVMQRRLGVWAYSLIVVTSVIFWFGGLSDCSRAAFQYHGMPTTEVSTCTDSQATCSNLRSLHLPKSCHEAAHALGSWRSRAQSASAVSGNSVPQRTEHTVSWQSAALFKEIYWQDARPREAHLCCLCLVLLQLMWATVSIIGMLFMQPTDPQKANPCTVVQLQQFSWTEGGLEEAIKVRGMCQAGHCS